MLVFVCVHIASVYYHSEEIDKTIVRCRIDGNTCFPCAQHIFFRSHLKRLHANKKKVDDEFRL